MGVEGPGGGRAAAAGELEGPAGGRVAAAGDELAMALAWRTKGVDSHSPYIRDATHSLAVVLSYYGGPFLV